MFGDQGFKIQASRVRAFAVPYFAKCIGVDSNNRLVCDKATETIVELVRNVRNGRAKVRRDESEGALGREQINSGNMIRAAAINSPKRPGKREFDKHGGPKSVLMKETVKSDITWGDIHDSR
jgi:hypothetical protein